jgi:hypothetical protein
MGSIDEKTEVENLTLLCKSLVGLFKLWEQLFEMNTRYVGEFEIYFDTDLGNGSGVSYGVDTRERRKNLDTMIHCFSRSQKHYYKIRYRYRNGLTVSC